MWLKIMFHKDLKQILSMHFTESFMVLVGLKLNELFKLRKKRF